MRAMNEGGAVVEEERRAWVLRVLGVDLTSDPNGAPVSVLPVAPDATTPQGVALIEAAAVGMPFCEECSSPRADETAATGA
jgi:hypothetical protein